MNPSKAEIERALFPKRNKYGNVRTNGRASKKEATIAAQLQALERGGVIRELREQVRFEVIPEQKGKLRNEKPVVYVADFAWIEVKNNSRHVGDAKGMRTPLYVLKRKLMKFVHEIEVEEF